MRLGGERIEVNNQVKVEVEVEVEIKPHCLSTGQIKSTKRRMLISSDISGRWEAIVRLGGTFPPQWQRRHASWYSYTALYLYNCNTWRPLPETAPVSCGLDRLLPRTAPPPRRLHNRQT